ncbi:MAG: hypothetical protein L3K13_09155, partial [Thermoplasmata archaeon]|nr:hypothetical protein [Thermoplasmata archaeon]
MLELSELFEELRTRGEQSAARIFEGEKLRQEPSVPFDLPVQPQDAFPRFGKLPLRSLRGLPQIRPSAIELGPSLPHPFKLIGSPASIEESPPLYFELLGARSRGLR